MTPAVRVVLAFVLACLGMSAVAAPAPSTAATSPSSDPFYSYSGSVPLRDHTLGTVLDRRVITHHLAGLPLPQRVTQVLYRTQDTQGEPTATVATVIPPLTKVFAKPRLVSYQFAYDAVGEACNPSYAYSGGFSLPGQINSGEQAAVVGYLLSGYTVVVSDYEGQDMHFGAGRESGVQTLDGIRAAVNSAAYGLSRTTPIALVGYSGGSIATEWAVEQAPVYAPEVNSRLVGAAMGGTPTDLEHLLSYIDGSFLWAGAIPLGLTGLARAYDIDLDPYTNDYGKQVLARTSNQCISQVLGVYAGLRFADLMKPQYGSFAKIPPLAKVREQVVMGRAGTPTAPLLFAVGKLGNTGDGIIVTKDVKDLATDYCGRGTSVRYQQYDGLEHVGGMVAFVPHAMAWISQRFASDGRSRSDSCASLLAGRDAG
ncbi:MAG TPA: lipase family protein [Nocardioides sp.]|nr:lipase family protein [Nocardioides sp.]